MIKLLIKSIDDRNLTNIIDEARSLLKKADESCKKKMRSIADKDRETMNSK